jgi:hypothetical protein
MLTSHVNGKPSALACRTNSTPAALEMRHKCTLAPVLRMSANKVCKAMVSAATGTPLSPMRVANAPLAATPCPKWASCGLSQTV